MDIVLERDKMAHKLGIGNSALLRVEIHKNKQMEGELIGCPVSYSTPQAGPGGKSL